ncbi:PHP domain-containing protein [Fusibacter sp. 3D3]|uniref:PHP domain-containing protein n=1 Tax=Fusibacter sp. 3D3 TaxID=1048380 RepID=UPI0008530427|nr:PHP domain-containing protein [Fusibacter sp. 3D3]GAU78028.1 predicted metal-dependent phosphoesterases [Fusibacter sp. 3D3]
MEIYYDLHIHSCLSPCGDADMTPNNIVNMALIKGLDVIAITDHNTSKNARVVCKIGKEQGLLVIPGMEVQTKEEVHVLCYFEEISDLEAFDSALEPYRLKIPNRPDHFGRQQIVNHEDQCVGEYPYALIASIEVSIEQLIELCKAHGGVCVPAHVNKSSNSILANLGFMPQALKVRTIEIHPKSPINETLIKGYQKIYNSDAHYLEHISERANKLEIDEKTISKILNYLSGEE